MGLLILFSGAGEEAEPEVPAITTIRRRHRLPRIYCTIDDEPVGADEWSANSHANLGHDQFRGRISAARARSLGGVVQGSLVKLWTETGFKLWEGRIAAPPKSLDDGTAVVAGQGHGYQAVKFVRRIGLRIADMGAWVPGHVSPLNAPLVGGASASASVTSEPQPLTVAVSRITDLQLHLSTASRASMAIWAPGTRFTAMRVGFMPVAGAGPYIIYTADGPNVAATMRAERHVTNSTSLSDTTVTFTSPGDCVLIEYNGSEVTSSLRVARGVVLIGDVPETMFADDAAKAIAGTLGFDPIGVRSGGGAVITHFDHADNAAAALTDLATGEDLRWLVLDDQGSGPVLDFGPYDKVWEVSSRTGAHWDLDPLELFNRATVQYLFTTKELSSGIERDTNLRALSQIAIAADPDPLEVSGLVNEIGLNLPQVQFGREYAISAAIHALRAGLSQRWRGTITTARAFEAGSGREATYEVRPGDLVRITDHSLDGSLTLRIADVQYSPQGITLGIEAPALPIGALSVTPAPTPIQAGQTGTYLPPGAPGGTPDPEGYRFKTPLPGHP